MDGIRDIRPLHPTFPKRPNDKIDKHQEQKKKENNSQLDDDNKDDDDAQPHVDEFA